MSDLFGIGTSALSAAQIALDTTGNNIANVNTDGYSRQQVEFGTLPSQGAGDVYIGSGVTTVGVDRVFDQFLEAEVLGYTSGSSQYQAYSDYALRMDSLLGTSGTALNESMDAVFAALQEVANNPTGQAEREVALGELQNLAGHQETLYRAMEDINLEINGRMESSVNEINTLTAGIADLNEAIVSASAGGATPNDLLDQRDAMIRDLSAIVDITVTEQGDGAVNIFLGGSQALVVGSTTEQLVTTPDPYDASRLNISVEGVDGNINDQITGGELRGLLDVREEVVDPAIRDLGLLSLGLTATLNEQNSLGTDLDGNLGSDLLVPVSIPVSDNTNNTGTAVPAVTISDSTDLQADSYQLDYSAGAWTLTRLSDSQSVTGASPLVMDGISVDVSAGVPVDGDSFLIEPARAGAAQFGVAETDPNAIAAAAPVNVEADFNNSGSLEASGLEVTDTVDLPLSGPVTLTFNPDALGPGVPGFDVTGAITTTVAYDPATDSDGVSVSLGLTGISFTLSGVPEAGDTVTMDNTAAGSGDNRNALAMAGLKDEALLAGGTQTYQDVYGDMLSGVAVKTASATSSLEVETALLQQAQYSSASVSGVNLDEEAANLLRFQQQYQAAAQIIATAEIIFDTLLSVVRN